MGATDPKVQRWALILGASSGIGEATARLAAEDGYNICGVYLGRSRGEKLDAARPVEIAAIATLTNITRLSYTKMILVCLLFGAILVELFKLTH